MAKKIPERMCIACREMKPKNTLLRLVRTPEGELVLDFSGKKSGRGAYICRNGECLKKARKSRAIERALDVKASEELLQQVADSITQGDNKT